MGSLLLVDLRSIIDVRTFFVYIRIHKQNINGHSALNFTLGFSMIDYIKYIGLALER